MSALISRYSLPKVPRRYGEFLVAEGSEFDWTFKQCYNSFFSYPKDERLAILDNVFGLKRFTDNEKIKLAMEALKSDESLTIVRKSADFLINKFKLEYKNLEISDIMKALKQKGYS